MGIRSMVYDTQRMSTDELVQSAAELEEKAEKASPSEAKELLDFANDLRRVAAEREE